MPYIDAHTLPRRYFQAIERVAGLPGISPYRLFHAVKGQHLWLLSSKGIDISYGFSPQ